MASFIERENYVQLAKIAKQDERYDSVFATMLKVASFDMELTGEELKLFNIGCKHMTSTVRFTNNSAELTRICNEIIAVIDDHLLPSTKTVKSIVFYYKIKGDCNRYMAEEYSSDPDYSERKHNAIVEATNAYLEGSALARVELCPTEPIRLCMALNFSVFYYSILKLAKTAFFHAGFALDEAIEDIDSLSDEAYEESNKVMKLLRDNTNLWYFDINWNEKDDIVVPHFNVDFHGDD